MSLKGCAARGEVEEWFKIIEDSMKYSLKVVFRNSILHYEADDTNRKEWVLAYPSQVILGVDSIYWTKITEEDFLGPEAFGDLDEWFERISKLIFFFFNYK